jgi:hypothetical protein
VQRRLGESGCTVWGCYIMAASFFGLAFITHLWELLAVVLPMMCAGTIVATVNTAQMTKVGPQGDPSR